MRTAAGAVQVRQPRVNDKRTEEMTGERKRFASAILPAWSRKSPRVAEVLPLLYLHGLSSSNFGPALQQFLGSDAGLSASTITRLTTQWQDEARAFNARSLAGSDYVYCWVDGIHLKVPLEQDKVCLLVMIGVRADGRKELIALADGFRESSESWADLLRDCKRRGMTAPVLAVGDGALGLWKAVRDVFPETLGAALLVPQAGQYSGRAAEVGAARGHEGAGRDLQRRRQDPRHDRGEGVRGRVRSQVAQSGGQDQRRSGRAAGVLGPPRRALDPPADHEPDRVDLRHRPAPAAGYQGTRLPGRRGGNGVQADRIGRNSVAVCERTSPGRPGPCRRHLQQRKTRRTTRPPRSTRRRPSSRMRHADPQVLTIAPGPGW